MTTDIIFDLLNPGHLSAQMADELKDANDRWGEPSTETLKMVVWLSMLAEKGHYTRLIDHARQRFTRELQTVEGIENAYRALPASLVSEPLHSQGLSACWDARQGAARALKDINSQYHSTISSASSTDETSGNFQDLHAAFIAFYRNMDEVDFQVAQVKDIGRESARLLRPLLEAQRQALEEKRTKRKQLQRQVRNIRRAIARRITRQRESDQVSARMLSGNSDWQEIARLNKRCKELEATIKLLRVDIHNQYIEMRQNELLVSRLVKGEEDLNCAQIGEKVGVSQQSASRRTRRLMEKGLLSSMGRDEGKHQTFTPKEVMIITLDWPTRGPNKAR